MFLSYIEVEVTSMSKFKKQIAVLFGAIAMISYLSIRFFPSEPVSTTPVIATKDEGVHMQIFLMDQDHTLVPLSIPVNEEMSEEDKLQLMLSYMSGKQEIKGFQKLFQKECNLQKVKIHNGLASLYFDNSLKGYKGEDELRILEALTWGATQFHDIEQVKLYMNNVELRVMPNANTPIPEVLNRSIGINHFETSTSTLHDSTSITVFYTKKIAGQQYMVPKSKRISDKDDTLKTSVQQILADISVSSNLQQPLYADHIVVKDFRLYDGSMIVDLNKNILGSNRCVKQDVYDALVLSLASIPNIQKVEVKVDGVNVRLPSQKDAMVSIHDIRYNEVKF